MIVESFMSLPYSFGRGGGRISIRFPEPVANAGLGGDISQLVRNLLDLFCRSQPRRGISDAEKFADLRASS
jgi:hypothetical protein